MVVLVTTIWSWNDPTAADVPVLVSFHATTRLSLDCNPLDGTVVNPVTANETAL